MPNAQEALAEKAQSVPPGTLRHTVLLAAKRFKASWAELGKLLTQVRNQGTWQEWGFDSFDTYCLKELRIRKATADKLTRAFSFLDKHEPKAVAGPDIAETAPPFEVVEVLAQAEDRGQLSAQEYRAVRDSIWNQDKPVSELRRDLQERYPAPEPERSEKSELRRYVALANRLASELKSSRKVPRSVVERAQALAEDLEELAKGQAEA